MGDGLCGLKQEVCITLNMPEHWTVLNEFGHVLSEKWKPSKCSLADLYRAIQIAIQASMMEPKTQICGGIVIFDFDGLSLSHIMQFTPTFAAMILQWVQVSIHAIPFQAF